MGLSKAKKQSRRKLRLRTGSKHRVAFDKQNKRRIKMKEPIYIADVGDYVKPDEWVTGWCLSEPNYCYTENNTGVWSFSLESPTLLDVVYAVNIFVTSRKATVRKSLITNCYYRCYRCKIEFVYEGDPSTWSGGWVSERN